MGPARFFLTLALVVAGAGAASADRFSREDCKQLKIEYADALTTAAPSDMEQGPDWAQSNLDLNRMRSIERLIDLEADLEFRCSMSRQRIAAIKPERKPVIPEIPERKELPDPPSRTAKAEAGQVLGGVTPGGAAAGVVAKKAGSVAAAAAPAVKTAPASKTQASTKAAATAKPAARMIAKGETAAVTPPAASVVKSPAPAAKPVSPSAGAAQKPAAKADQPPPKVAAQQPKPPAKPKKNKPNPSYISPREVSPLGLYRNGANW